MSKNLHQASILFSDLSGFSRLSEKEMGLFFEIVLDRLTHIITKEKPLVSNTWGDALYLVFDNTDAAARCALAIRDTVKNTDWKSCHITKDLKIRIALHAATITMVTDPVTHRDNAVGVQVNKVARLEPVVPPNEVFVTEEFKKATKRSKTIRFDDIGLVTLAKKWGSSHIYRLRRKTDAALLPTEYVALFPTQ